MKGQEEAKARGAAQSTRDGAEAGEHGRVIRARFDVEGLHRGLDGEATLPVDGQCLTQACACLLANGVEIGRRLEVL